MTLRRADIRWLHAAVRAGGSTPLRSVSHDTRLVLLREHLAIIRRERTPRRSYRMCITAGGRVAAWTGRIS